MKTAIQQIDKLLVYADGDILYPNYNLLVAAAAGRKGAVIEMDIPRYDTPKRGNIFSKFSYLGNTIEQTVNAHYIGINRDEIACVVSPDMHTQLIRDIPAGAVFEGKVLE